jgi:cystathionine beta-lyase/cystathionine gamma-synthase
MSEAFDTYLDPQNCPSVRPPWLAFDPATRELHEQIDASARRQGMPYLHPEDPTLQLDMFGSRHMTDWQEKKAEWVFAGERCWSDLHQFYARYGVETSRPLMAALQKLENAEGVILTDCGMQALALTIDALAFPGGHAILMRGVYNKTRRYLEWLGNRLKFEVTIVEDGDEEGATSAIRPESFVLLAETYTNPLMRALNPESLGARVVDARGKGSPRLRFVVDNTIASPWSVQRPLLDYEGVDIIAASGTKALGGQDRDLWGYVASNHIDFLNEVMDLQAMRGGALDWRRSRAILGGLDHARENFEKRCNSATDVAAFLESHPRVESVYHPSLESHPDRDNVVRYYCRPGSLLAFKLRQADEDTSRHFADVLATCGVLRYAGSFDGLTTKVNHHRTVSEYFTPDEELVKAGIERVIRLGIGVETTRDIIACLNWALCHYQDVTEEEILDWQAGREQSLGLDGDRQGS